MTFTMGNTPGADLMCQSPGGMLFLIEVKSVSSKSCWLYQEAFREPDPHRYFVFVFLPESTTEGPEYFVMNNEQFLRLGEESDRYGREREKKRGKKYATSWVTPGIVYPVMAGSAYRDAWKNLPQ